MFFFFFLLLLLLLLLLGWEAFGVEKSNLCRLFFLGVSRFVFCVEFLEGLDKGFNCFFWETNNGVKKKHVKFWSLPGSD